MMLDYRTTMAIGEDRYRDVLDLLAAAGLDAAFIQTGGMCAALEVVLDNGHSLLITDEEDTLAWDRAEHEGWAVGLYPPHRDECDSGCLQFDCTSDGSPEALVPLIHAALRRHALGGPA